MKGIEKTLNALYRGNHTSHGRFSTIDPSSTHLGHRCQLYAPDTLCDRKRPPHWELIPDRINLPVMTHTRLGLVSLRHVAEVHTEMKLFFLVC